MGVQALIMSGFNPAIKNHTGSVGDLARAVHRVFDRLTKVGHDETFYFSATKARRVAGLSKLDDSLSR